MKSLSVSIITQPDPFYLPHFFDPFLEKAREQDDLTINSIRATPTFDESTFSTVRRLMGFYGLYNFTRLLGRYGAIKLKDYLGFDSKTVPRIARRYDIPFEKVDSVNNSSFLETLRSEQPDVILSVAASQIFEKELIELPEWGTLNLHNSFLPDYRGMMPVFWQLKDGRDEIGITLHTMTETLDYGRILEQSRVPVRSEECLDSLVRRVKEKGADVVVEGLEAIAHGDEELRKMKGDGSYNSFPSAQDARALREAGHNLL